MKYLLFTSFFIFQFSIKTNAQTFNLQDSTFQVGDVFISNDILFHFDKDRIMDESIAVLDSIAVFIISHASLTIEIGWHTDSRGNDNYCKDLSQRRAQAIYKYLISKKCAANKLTFKGHGAVKLLITDKEIAALEGNDEKEKAHQTNRRTEFIIINTVL